MFINKLTKNRAQATTEIALFGTVMLIVFAVLLRYGMIFNAKQEERMYTFRQALNLTRQRRLGNLEGSRQFASVRLSTSRNVFPVSGRVGVAQEVSGAESSASILAETEVFNFGDSDGPRDFDDVGGNYRQIGERMRHDKTYIEPTYIKVTRKVDEDNTPRHPWDGIADFLDGADEKDEYDTWEPIPYREIEIHTNVTHSNEYVIWEEPQWEEPPRAIYYEDGQTRIISTTVNKPPAYDLPTLEQKMKEWDPDLVSVNGIVGGGNEVQDLTITIDRTIDKQRLWYSEKQ